jgi:hypothetical protein
MDPVRSLVRDETTVIAMCRNWQEFYNPVFLGGYYSDERSEAASRTRADRETCCPTEAQPLRTDNC